MCVHAYLHGLLMVCLVACMHVQRLGVCGYPIVSLHKIFRLKLLEFCLINITSLKCFFLDGDQHTEEPSPSEKTRRSKRSSSKSSKDSDSDKEDRKISPQTSRKVCL